MDLVFHHVMEFQDVHIANSGLFSEFFASTSVTKLNLSIFWQASSSQFGLNIFFSRSREWRYYSLITKCVRRHAKVKFKNLTQVDTRRYAEWSQKNVDWTTVLCVRHIFFRQDARNNTLVTVTTS